MYNIKIWYNKKRNQTGDKMKNKLKNILLILLFVMPIVDLLTSIITRFLPNVISLGIIVKGLLSFICIVYVFLISKSKYKKVSICFYLLMAAYVLIYIFSKNILFNFSFLFKEIVYLFKYFYIFIIFWGLLNIFTDTKLEKNTIKKIMSVNLIIYLINIIL